MKVVSKRESKFIKLAFTVILTIVSVLTCALIGLVVVTPIIDYFVK
jgi:hypothetical protein